MKNKKLQNQYPGLHSEKYLGDYRLSWWHQDYVDLLLDRADARRARSVLDIGIGCGHWAEIVMNGLHRPAALYGVDRESRWLAEAEDRLKRHAAVSAFVPLHAAAEAIPLPSGSVDLATCQTLLMHSQAPKTVASEMVRVVRPGGALVVIEPVNAFNRMQLFELARLGIGEDHLDIIRFWSHYHEHLRKHHGMDHDIGAKLDEVFAGLGVREMAFFQNDSILQLPTDGRPDLDAYEYADDEVRQAFFSSESGRTLYAKGLAAFEKLNRRYGDTGNIYLLRQNLIVMVARV